MVGELEALLGLDLRSMVLATGTAALLVASALTWPLSTALLWAYRRAVRAGMAVGTTVGTAGPRTTVAGGVGPGGTVPSPGGTVPSPVGARPVPAARSGSRIGVRPATADDGAPLVRRADRAAGRAVRTMAAAGLVYGLASTWAYHEVADLEWLPVRTIALVALLGWLVVPTVIATARPSAGRQVLLWAALPLLTVALPAATGSDVVELLQLFAVVVGAPGAVVLLTSGRGIRAAAWLVLPAVAVGTAALIVLYVPLTYVRVGVPLDRLARTLVLVAAGLVLLLVVYGAVGAWAYRRKWVSDDTLLVLQWWVVLTLAQAFLLGTQGWANAGTAVLPLALMLAVLTVAHRRRRDPPVRLLLLRTFGSRRRSSRLLRDLTGRWRWVGSVELITGADLATELLEPPELVDFLTGRLRRHFVRDEADLRRRVAGLDLRADRDGRYRVNELLCHEHTWRPALRALVGEVDAVLVDLRGLGPGNTGVIHEIEQLVALVPLDRVVALTDGTTHGPTLRFALDRGAAEAPDDAPLHLDPAPALRTVPVPGRSADDRVLLAAVAAAATAGGRAGEETVAGPPPGGLATAADGLTAG